MLSRSGNPVTVSASQKQRWMHLTGFSDSALSRNNAATIEVSVMAKGERARITEKNAYAYINLALKDLGWDPRNPSRHPEGQVYTDNQALEHPELRKGLVRDRPENVVKVTESKFWVIEAKSRRREIAQALKEAEDYAREINNASTLVQAVIVSGVAGNDDDGYLVESRFLHGGDFHPIYLNGQEISGLLSPAIAYRLLDESTPDLEDIPVDESAFLSTAEAINEELHRGAINKNQRASVMAALLLALVDDTMPNIDANPGVLIRDINSRAEVVLRRNGKEAFYRFVQILLPAAEDNHLKFRRALVRTIQALTNLNIRSTMSSGTDMLGKFYEVFLKYGNGAKEIGIVLTPRHVTRFAARALDVNYRDVVYDPTCGTGGFLVAALDHVRASFQLGTQQLEDFKVNGLFGIDQDPVVTSLAIVNMIFRNDGRNHINEGNAFSRFLERASAGGVPTANVMTEPPRAGQEGATKILMNPPFALKQDDERERHFVDVALRSLVAGGLLFVIVPISSMVEGGSSAAWRRDLLAQHSLLAVVSFPEELFYPVANQTVALVIRKDTPHRPDSAVLWARVVNDGFRKSKGKRIPNEGVPNDLEQLIPVLQVFIQNPSVSIESIPEKLKAAPVDFTDPHFELVPEAYVDDASLSEAVLAQEIDRLVRENAAFLIREHREQD